MRTFSVEVEMVVKVTCGKRARIYKASAETYAMEGESARDIKQTMKRVGFCGPPAQIIRLAMRDFE